MHSRRDVSVRGRPDRGRTRGVPRRRPNAVHQPMRRPARLRSTDRRRPIGRLGVRGVRDGPRLAAHMTPAAGRGLRIGTAVLSVAMGTWTAPVAGAVTPPAVDHSLLPPPSSPAPPAATEPIGACHPVAHAGRSSGPMQLTTLGIPTLRPLSRGSGQTVAVIDTGVARHRLLPRLTAGGDYVATGD